MCIRDSLSAMYGCTSLMRDAWNVKRDAWNVMRNQEYGDAEYKMQDAGFNVSRILYLCTTDPRIED